MRFRITQILCTLVLTAPVAVIGQTLPPFIGGPVTAFDVQVSVIESGALLDATPVISQDRRYVTINAQPSNTSLLALQQFRTQTAQTIGSGYVGGVNPAGVSNSVGSFGTNNTAATPAASDGRSLNQSPTSILEAAKNSASVLNHRGVYLLSPLK